MKLKNKNLIISCDFDQTIAKVPHFPRIDGLRKGAKKYINKLYDKGHYIIINHNNGYYTNYGHLSARLVKKGDIVSIGQQIGKMGATGFAFGTHLHFGVWKGYPYVGGKSINPAKIS